MARPAALLKRTLIFIHRWLGVALSVIFLLWFASGIVMMYWTYPEVGTRERLAHAPVLRAQDIKVTVEDAYAALGRTDPAGLVRLTSFAGRPVYRFGGGGGRRGGGGGNGRGTPPPSMVYADEGSVQSEITDDLLARAATSWSGRPLSEAKKVSVTEVDQWTVGNLRNVRPLYKYSWPDGQQVYVNGNTAEVGQYTTTESRLWAYLGAIPHWLYFTPLRKHAPQWNSVVVWSSLIGTGAAILGLIIAVWMYSPRKRYRHDGAPTSIPYRGWKRWHTIAGLFFGVITTTWTFSGLLSMGPFPIIDKLTELTVPTEAARAQGNSGEARGERRRGGGRGGLTGTALRGRPPALSDFSARPAANALEALKEFEPKELEYTSFGGTPVYIATNGRGETRVVPLDGDPRPAFDIDTLMRTVREAAGPGLKDLQLMTEYDAYYLDRLGERPLPVIVAYMNDAVGTRYYIDPTTASVAGSYSSRGWVNRWLYHGLHSLDFPWLYKYRPLWDIVVITLLLGGTALCVTSLVLACRLLIRKAVAALADRTPASEDLALEIKEL